MKYSLEKLITIMCFLLRLEGVEEWALDLEALAREASSGDRDKEIQVLYRLGRYTAPKSFDLDIGTEALEGLWHYKGPLRDCLDEMLAARGVKKKKDNGIVGLGWR